MEDNRIAEIISGCVNGNPKSQSELYDTLKPILLNVCQKYYDIKEDAEDALMESFAKILMNIKSYKGSTMAELVGWSKTIAKHRVIDRLRLSSTGKRNGLHVDYGQMHGEQPYVLNEASPDRESILALMVDMPEKQRMVFMLHEIEGYEYDELVIMLGMRMNTVKTNYHRARKWLMARIDADMKKADRKQ